MQYLIADKVEPLNLLATFIIEPTFSLLYKLHGVGLMWCAVLSSVFCKIVGVLMLGSLLPFVFVGI